MAMKQVIEILELLDTPKIEPGEVEKIFLERGVEKEELRLENLKEERGETLFIKIRIKGENGKSRKGSSPTLGVIGRLGGIGARPHKVGLVSESIDTTKGNRIINQRGFAISPTVKDGYILRVSEDLLDIMQIVTGKLPVVFAITTQDITPYGNRIYHLNSIMQPSTVTQAPVVGAAITTEVPVPGCATGANHVVDIEMAV